MKYIRTKDRIFDIEKNGGIRTIVKIYDVDESLRLKYQNTNNPQQVGDRFVIIENKDYKITDNNTADTIEELVDEYVLREKANCKLDVDYGELTEDDVKLCLQDHDIFGAIWVNGDKEEPILKSVAKMNNEGDLELL